MVARLIFASPSHALSVPINSANGRPDEKPKASIVPALRVERAALSSFQPLGRFAAGVAVVAATVPPAGYDAKTLDRFHGLPSPAMNGPLIPRRGRRRTA